MRDYTRDIVAISRVLGRAKENRKGGTLLIGAGCSVTAEIPSAADIIVEIRELLNRSHEDLSARSYGGWMDMLATDQRHELIMRYITRAKINWAHICIASLMASGHVDRILTTNFDPLIIHACALLGEFPAVYDFAASTFLKPHLIPRKAVFYLHGQISGFVLKNTPREIDDHAEHLKRIIEAVVPDRVIIVVGYSGLNDKIFDHLTQVDDFGFGLYWVGYGDRDPPAHVLERLLKPRRDTWYTKGYDADRFFDELTKNLSANPPRLVGEPFTHLLESFLGRVTPEEKYKRTREMLLKAVDQFERRQNGSVGGKETPFTLRARELVAGGNYDGVISLTEEYFKSPSPEGADLLSRAHLLKGDECAKRAAALGGEEGDALFAEAIVQYRAALKVKPNLSEVLNNWGTALYDRAKARRCDDINGMLTQAVERFNGALGIQPDYFEALVNRGAALSDLAKRLEGGAADPLFTQAIQDFEAAVALRRADSPEAAEAFYHWGNVLRRQAYKSPTAGALLDGAVEKYSEALRLNPDYPEVLNSWGSVLFFKSQKEKGELADDLVNEAFEKFYQADLKQKGSSAYNLARLNALTGDSYGCKLSLERAKYYGTLPPREYLTADPFLANVRDEDWFRKFVEQL